MCPNLVIFTLTDRQLNKVGIIFIVGFLYKEIEKADIHVSEAIEYPETPQLREMIDLEVGRN